MDNNINILSHIFIKSSKSIFLANIEILILGLDFLPNFSHFLIVQIS